MQTKATRRKGIRVLAVVAGALALAAALLLILLRVAAPNPAARYAVLYAKGGQNLWLAVPEGVFPLRGSPSQGEAQRQVFTENGKYLYYGSGAVDGRGDVCLVGLRDAASRKEGGKPVAKGVLAWTVSTDGRYLSYVEEKGRVLRCYDAEMESTQELSPGVEAVYAAPGQDFFFFTKPESRQLAVFRCAAGRQPERITDAMEKTGFYANETHCELLYLRSTEGAGNALYMLGQSGAPVLIAENVETVLEEFYQIGGNLYFLKRGESAAVEPVTLEDPQAPGDEAMAEPQKPPSGPHGGILSGILEGIGQIIGGNTDTAYERQLAAYREKQERDKVRAAARKALEAFPAQGAALLDCYVYDGAGARKLATGVRAKAQMAARPSGRPALLFEKERLTAGESAQAVTLTELLMRYRAGGEKAVKEFILGLAGGDTQAAGLALAMMAGDGANEIPMGQAAGGGAGWQAVFLPDAEELLYLERDVEDGPFSLYTFALTEYGVSERRLAGTNAALLTPVPGGAYYFQQEPGAARGALYWYQGGKSTKLLGNAGAFFLSGKNAGALLALSDVKDGAGTLSAAVGAQLRTLNGGVKIDDIHAGGGQVCYLTQWREGAGTLCLQAFDSVSLKDVKKAKVLDTGVTEIIDIRR